MAHVDAKIIDDKLVITVDIGKEAIANATLSSTGKSRVIATTRGFAWLGNISYSLNVITK